MRWWLRRNFGFLSTWTMRLRERAAGRLAVGCGGAGLSWKG